MARRWQAKPGDPHLTLHLTYFTIVMRPGCSLVRVLGWEDDGGQDEMVIFLTGSDDDIRKTEALGMLAELTSRKTQTHLAVQTQTHKDIVEEFIS